MTQLKFTKMHGLGNDFVIIDDRDGALKLSLDSVRAISDRRWGVGCDQFIVLEPASDPDADVFMRIYNPDGSQSGACGNATRCVASLLITETGRTEAIVQTTAGLLDCENLGGGQFSVDMGPAKADWRDLPLSKAMDTDHIDLTVGPLGDGVGVNVGNPHVVFMVDDVDTIDLATYGPKIETHDLFPQHTNVEIVQVLAPEKIRMRVWERGAGITQACGSGACAALVATARRGLTNRKADVILDGGVLTIDWRPDNTVLMTGPVFHSFQGSLDLDGLEPKP
ncbi:MAG: diaminopimelate epimerase [Magnetovibrio sp.]|nr:diaminopimelate epimerase [Magnetovibrio sp.]